MTTPSFNPIATLMRSLTGPTGSMGGPHHSELVANHFQHRDRVGLLEDQVDMVEYLLNSIQTAEQAQEAMEWLAARWPSPGVVRKTQTDSDTDILSTVKRVALIMDAIVNKGVDLNRPLQHEGPIKAIGEERVPLGELLVLLGHAQYTPQVVVPEDEKRLQSLVLCCARNGHLDHCAYWINQASEFRDRLIMNTWLLLAQERTTPLQDLHMLPPPPSEWWRKIFENNNYRNGPTIRNHLMQQNPDSILTNVQAALNTANISLISDEHLQFALTRQDQWTSCAGWKGGALDVALSDTTYVMDGQRAPNFIEDLLKTRWSALVDRVGPLQSGHLSVDEWSNLIQMAKFTSASKETRLSSISKRMDPKDVCEALSKLPKTRTGAPDPELSFLVALTTTKTDELQTMKRTLPALRMLMDQDAMPIEHIYDRGLTVCGIMKQLLSQASKIRIADLDQEQGNIVVEHLIWQFWGKRMQQCKGRDLSMEMQLPLMPADINRTKQIKALIESGHRPQWDKSVGERVLHVLSHPIVGTPPEILSMLQQLALENTPQALSMRPKARL